MRLEIMIGNSDPLIYPIKGGRTVIGSAETSDIVLPAGGISRKHLVVAVENEQYFVIDQGSTNGSYINEERLIPGRRVEFTSFFPVRLGDDVLISLVSDDEDEYQETSPSSESSAPKNLPKTDHEATSVISLKQLKEVKTEKLIKRREEKRKKVVKKKAPSRPVVKKKKMKINSVVVMAVLLLAGAAYYNFFVLNPTADESLEATPTPPPARVPTRPKVEAPSHLIAEVDLPNVEDLKSLFQTIKCVTDVEKYLCEVFTGSEHQYWGVSQVGTMAHIMMDVQPLLDEARKLISFPEQMDESQKLQFDKLTKEVLAVYFFMKVVPDALNLELLKDLKLNFVFYQMGDSGPEYFSAVAVTPAALMEFKSHMKPHFLDTLRTPENDIVVFGRKYYRVY